MAEENGVLFLVETLEKKWCLPNSCHVLRMMMMINDD
jgi:hypothetical protein